MTYRNRKLLDLSHTMPCMASFEHQCFGHLGCDPAHSDSSAWGRGHGHKSHDFAFAAMCNQAHQELSRMDREQKAAEWTFAHVKTMRYLWENKLIRVI